MNCNPTQLVEFVAEQDLLLQEKCLHKLTVHMEVYLLAWVGRQFCACNEDANGFYRK
jgi:hypothetical protein